MAIYKNVCDFLNCLRQQVFQPNSAVVAFKAIFESKSKTVENIIDLEFSCTLYRSVIVENLKLVRKSGTFAGFLNFDVI